MDKPDREPFCRFDLENVNIKAKREHHALLNSQGLYNQRDPFMGQVSEMGIPYSRHKEMIHDSFSGVKNKSGYSPSNAKKNEVSLRPDFS